MATGIADEKFMQAAIAEAKRGTGQTSPNPIVGAVVVVRGKIVATGFHKRAGAPHAEIECLRALRARDKSKATLYVTLEPCSTEGRTGACTRAIIESGVRTVVIGAIDPNPRHRGRGFELLRAAGLTVRSGVLATECTALNPAFNKWVQTGIPYVIAKCGMTLDGRLTRLPREGRWLTSTASRADAMKLRASVDAILVGGETVRLDNPRLTVRGMRGARQPWRVIVARSGKLPQNATVFSDRFAARTLVFRNKSLTDVLRELGKREITSVLIEGGGEILGQALDSRVIDEFQLYVAPVLTGGPVPAFGARGVALPADAVRLSRVAYDRIGPDVRIIGYPEPGLTSGGAPVSATA